MTKEVGTHIERTSMGAWYRSPIGGMRYGRIERTEINTICYKYLLYRDVYEICPYGDRTIPGVTYDIKWRRQDIAEYSQEYTTRYNAGFMHSTDMYSPNTGFAYPYMIYTGVAWLLNGSEGSDRLYYVLLVNRAKYTIEMISDSNVYQYFVYSWAPEYLSPVPMFSNSYTPETEIKLATLNNGGSWTTGMAPLGQVPIPTEYSVDDGLQIGGDAVPTIYGYGTAYLSSQWRRYYATPVFNVQYVPTFGGSISGDAFQTIERRFDGTGSTATAVTATPASGYEFYRWADDYIGSTRTDTDWIGIINKDRIRAYFRDA